MTTLVVMAKECLPGRVKTRLAARLGFETAAAIAAASLADTLRLGERLSVQRRILCIDGAAPPGAERYDVVPQCEGGLDERIAAVLALCEGPTAVIGMDTPQLRPADLAPVFADDDPEAGAWFGPASDGGFWLLGLREPRPDLVRGVGMSRPDTGAVQLARLRAAGLTVRMLAERTDIDTAEALDLVAGALAADSATSRALMEVAA